MVMLANQPPHLICIRLNVNSPMFFRIAIPAPHREIREELNTYETSTETQVVTCASPMIHNQT